MENQEQTPEATPAARLAIGRWAASVGPGLVYGLTVLGTGDIVSNSAAGASYGYALIWALAMTLIFRFVWVNTSAKYVLVTGESLLTGYGRLGPWVPFIVLFSFFPIRHLTNQYLILIMGSSGHLLMPLPTAWSEPIWACLFTLAGFAMTFWGGYRLIESFCKILVAVMGGSLLVSVLVSRPDPVALLQGTFVPSLPQAEGLYSAVLIVMALIGTEAGSNANLTYAYFVQERGWTGLTHLKQQRFDLATGVLALFVMGLLVQVAAAGTIHPLGIQVEDPEDLSRIFSQTQGMLGALVFGLGLWGAAFSSFIGMNVGFGLIFTDICRTFVPFLKQPAERRPPGYRTARDPLYRGIIAFWSFAPLYIIFTQTRAIWLVLTVMAFLVLLIPIYGIALLKITNDRRLMGRHTNGWLTNAILVTLVLIALYFTYQNAVQLWENIRQIR